MEKDNLVFCISCYCDTPEKENTLIKNINFIKSKGHDVALISSEIPFSPEIQSLVDYAFISKENHKTDWPSRCFSMWKEWILGSKRFKLTMTQPYYGWNCLLHIKRLGELMMNHNYKKFVFMIYDVIFDESHLEDIYQEKDKIVFPTKKGDVIREQGLFLFSVSESVLKKFISLMSLDVFLSKNWGISKYTSENIFKPLNFVTSSKYVDDSIYFFDKEGSIFNHSPSPNIKFFFSTPYNSKESVKIFLYDNSSIHGRIICNKETIFDGNLFSTRVVDLDYCKNEIKELYCVVNGTPIDLLPSLTKITHSTLEEKWN